MPVNNMNNISLEMKTNSLTENEKKRIFLSEYYFGYGILISILRFLGGPLILGLGLYFLSEQNDNNLISYNGFMILYGIYYILKPIIFLYTKKEYFDNFDLEFKFEPERLILRKNLIKSEVDYSEFKKVIERDHYFILKLSTKQSIHICKNQLNDAEYEIINLIKRN